MCFFVAKMGRILQTLGLLDICFMEWKLELTGHSSAERHQRAQKLFTRGGHFHSFHFQMWTPRQNQWLSSSPEA